MELKNAVAFELSADPEKRAEQIAFNHKLILGAAGLLAEITGSERYLSIGTGHTMAICRASNTRRRTTEKMLPKRP